MPKDKVYWVYILASAIGGTLYIGVTNDLVRRVYEHKTGVVPGFTSRYRIHDSCILDNSATLKMPFVVRSA